MSKHPHNPASRKKSETQPRPNIIIRAREQFANAFQRYPVLISLAITLMIGGLIFVTTKLNKNVTVEEVVETDVHVDDSLALNIMCLPTLEALPLYHALESGISDSLRLPLGIFTQNSQFDVDSIIKRTKTIDGAMLDTYRMAYYAKSKKTLPVTEAFKLYGIWQLITAGDLRIKDVENLKKRTIATARFATSNFLLEKILNGKDIKATDVYLAQINDFSIRTNMLDENQIDACVLPEPFATLAISRGHHSVWSDKLTQTYSLYFRNDVMKDKRKSDQIELLRKVYNASVLDLNTHGTHAADSVLIKTFHLPKEVIDTLKLPEYRPI